MSTTVTIRVPDDVLEALDKCAAGRGTTRSGVVMQAIQGLLSSPPASEVEKAPVVDEVMPGVSEKIDTLLMGVQTLVNRSAAPAVEGDNQTVALLRKYNMRLETLVSELKSSPRAGGGDAASQGKMALAMLSVIQTRLASLEKQIRPAGDWVAQLNKDYRAELRRYPDARCTEEFKVYVRVIGLLRLISNVNHVMRDPTYKNPNVTKEAKEAFVLSNLFEWVADLDAEFSRLNSPSEGAPGAGE